MRPDALIGWRVAKADQGIASFRLRAQAIIHALRARGHRVELFDPANAGAYDVLVFSKVYNADCAALAAAAKARGGKVVFDLCDNHFYNPLNLPRYRQSAKQMLHMIALADRVICSTPALGRVVHDETDGAVAPIVIGDFVETGAAPLAPSRPDQRQLLWFGSHGSPNAPGGMEDLLRIEAELIGANRKQPFELTVCSNNRAKFDAAIAPLPFATRYVEWSQEALAQCFSEASAVVIPISPNPFTACKTHNRLTTALYAGLPVLADGIEAYEEFAPWSLLDDWSAGLDFVLQRNAEAREQALNSRPYMETHWSLDVIADAWSTALGLPTAPRDRAEQAAPEDKSAPMAASAGAVPFHGGIDSLALDAITGWVRPLSGGPAALDVRLETDRGVLARARASEPRHDLAVSGLEGFDCGFRFSIQDLPPGGLQSSFWIVEEKTGWPVAETSYRALAGGEQGYVIIPDQPSPHAPHRELSVEAAPPHDRQKAAIEIASDAQQLLMEEISQFSTAVEQARRSAARLVLAVGDDADLAGRIIAALRPPNASRQD